MPRLTCPYCNKKTSFEVAKPRTHFCNHCEADLRADVDWVWSGIKDRIVGAAIRWIEAPENEERSKSMELRNHIAVLKSFNDGKFPCSFTLR